MVPMKPGNAGGVNGPGFWCASNGDEDRRLAMSLTTPMSIRTLQRKLYCKAKAEPAYRFYLFYDTSHRDDILAHAYALARANAGAPGVDEMTFAAVEAIGQEEWLARDWEGPRRKDL